MRVEEQKLDEITKRYFPKETSNKLLKGAQTISLDDEAKWLFEEIFEDIGFKRLDKTGELSKDFEKLCNHIDFFRRKCLKYWRQYNSLSNKKR